MMSAATFLPTKLVFDASGEFQVLVEGPSADSDLVWQARLASQAPEIDGVCYITDPGEAPLTAGEFRRMRITKAHDYDLSGELVDVPASAPPPSLISIQRTLSVR